MERGPADARPTWNVAFCGVLLGCLDPVRRTRRYQWRRPAARELSGPYPILERDILTSTCFFGRPLPPLRMLSSRAPRELQREKTWGRLHLVPLLLAEGDRDAYRREQAALEREKEIMKNVKGWEVRVSSDISSEPVELMDGYRLHLGLLSLIWIWACDDDGN